MARGRRIDHERTLKKYQSPKRIATCSPNPPFSSSAAAGTGTDPGTASPSLEAVIRIGASRAERPGLARAKHREERDDTANGRRRAVSDPGATDTNAMAK